VTHGDVFVATRPDLTNVDAAVARPLARNEQVDANEQTARLLNTAARDEAAEIDGREPETLDEITTVLRPSLSPETNISRLGTTNQEPASGVRTRTTSDRTVTSHEAKAAMHSTPCTSPRASARPPNVGARCVTRPASSTMAKA
jgi:hypothetical protein